MDNRRFNLFALGFSLLVVIGIAVRGEPQQERWEPFLEALAQKESSGDPNAWNRRKDACGLYQIRRCYVDDVNRILGQQRFCQLDRWDTKTSALMVVIYLDYYATRKRLGHRPTWTDRARIHNGGPCGFKKSNTVQYGKDIVRIMTESTGE
jgi:hypothetical protein